MRLNRNDICRCGTGLKFKNCCGSLRSKPPIPIKNTLPLGSSISTDKTNPFNNGIYRLLERGNLAEADARLRIMLDQDPGNASIFNSLGWISSALDLNSLAISYFEKSHELDKNWSLPIENLKLINDDLSNFYSFLPALS